MKLGLAYIPDPRGGPEDPKKHHERPRKQPESARKPQKAAADTRRPKSKAPAKPESPQEDQNKSHEYQVSIKSKKSDQNGSQGPEMTKNGSDIENAIEPQ